MEPIASSGAGAVFRPAGAASSELGALLRDGRVLHAEVLSSAADGTVLLAIGRHTIPAESELRLDPGASFLVRVERDASGVILGLLAPPEVQEAALLAALRQVVAEERPLGELLGELAQAMRAALGRAAPPGDLPVELRALAQGLGAFVARPDGDAGALRTLLHVLGLGHEAALLGGHAAPEVLARLRGDLKSQLLRAQLALESTGSEHGELRAAVARALTGLEAEQLLNVARERAGEPLVLSFPFSDGDGWATARMLVPSRRERERERGESEEPPFRLALGLELARLGPVRVDLTLAPALLALRISVTRADVARRLESELPRLRERLSVGARVVELVLRLATPAEVALARLPLDIRYLRENHLMNVAG